MCRGGINVFYYVVDMDNLMYDNKFIKNSFHFNFYADFMINRLKVNCTWLNTYTVPQFTLNGIDFYFSYVIISILFLMIFIKKFSLLTSVPTKWSAEE